MTARTITLAPAVSPRPITWGLVTWIARYAFALLARLGLALTLIAVGGLLVPLFA